MQFYWFFLILVGVYSLPAKPVSECPESEICLTTLPKLHREQVFSKKFMFGECSKDSDCTKNQKCIGEWINDFDMVFQCVAV